VRQPRIDLARQTLGWKPQISLNEGLARTIEWFRERATGEAPRGRAGDTSEPEGRGADWTEEQSDEGRRGLKAPRGRAGDTA
jgi:hypothetical protein